MSVNGRHYGLAIVTYWDHSNNRILEGSIRKQDSKSKKRGRNGDGKTIRRDNIMRADLKDEGTEKKKLGRQHSVPFEDRVKSSAEAPKEKELFPSELYIDSDSNAKTKAKAKANVRAAAEDEDERKPEVAGAQAEDANRLAEIQNKGAERGTNVGTNRKQVPLFMRPRIDWEQTKAMPMGMQRNCAGLKTQGRRLLNRLNSSTKDCFACNKKQSLEHIIMANLNRKYLTSRDTYNLKVINDIIYNESTHIVSIFKDYLIYDDASEFLKRYYSKKESLHRLPRVYHYYDAYSKVFPNFITLEEKKYMFKNIERKQRVIDAQQKLQAAEENPQTQRPAEGSVEERIFTTHFMNDINGPQDTLQDCERDGPNSSFEGSQNDTQMQSYLKSQHAIGAQQEKGAKKSRNFEDLGLQELVDKFILKDSHSLLDPNATWEDLNPPSDFGADPLGSKPPRGEERKDKRQKQEAVKLLAKVPTTLAKQGLKPLANRWDRPAAMVQAGKTDGDKAGFKLTAKTADKASRERARMPLPSPQQPQSQDKKLGKAEAAEEKEAPRESKDKVDTRLLSLNSAEKSTKVDSTRSSAVSRNTRVSEAKLVLNVAKCKDVLLRPASSQSIQHALQSQGKGPNQAPLPIQMHSAGGKGQLLQPPSAATAAKAYSSKLISTQSHHISMPQRPDTRSRSQGKMLNEHKRLPSSQEKISSTSRATPIQGTYEKDAPFRGEAWEAARVRPEALKKGELLHTHKLSMPIISKPSLGKGTTRNLQLGKKEGTESHGKAGPHVAHDWPKTSNPSSGTKIKTKTKTKTKTGGQTSRKVTPIQGLPQNRQEIARLVAQTARNCEAKLVAAGRIPGSKHCPQPLSARNTNQGAVSTGPQQLPSSAGSRGPSAAEMRPTRGTQGRLPVELSPSQSNKVMIEAMVSPLAVSKESGRYQEARAAGTQSNAKCPRAEESPPQSNVPTGYRKFKSGFLNSLSRKQQLASPLVPPVPALESKMMLAYSRSVCALSKADDGCGSGDCAASVVKGTFGSGELDKAKIHESIKKLVQEPNTKANIQQLLYSSKRKPFPAL